jgi:XXXCH domain-containing protein
MGDSPKQKIDGLFSAVDAAELLRRLAEGLEQGVVRFNEHEVAFAGQVKIKGEIKAKKDKTGLKLNLKFPGVAPSAEETPDNDPVTKPVEEDESEEDVSGPDSGKKSYKKLKKKMKGEFKEIRAYIARDETPPVELIEVFQADCQIMTSFPDKGDEYYEQFNAEAYDMLGAAQSGDLEALKTSINNLAGMKAACHERYK